VADNTILNTGAGGDTIATDDIAGVKHQRVKVEFGGDGSATEVQVTAPLPVRQSDGVAYYSTTKEGQLPAVLVGGRLDVVVGAALPAGTANIGDVDVLSLPSLPAGINNIGDVDVLSLPSLPAGTNNIGEINAVGPEAHDAPAAKAPIRVAARASAAAPADVSLDGDVVNTWALRNGSIVVNLAAVGALIPGDAANGLDVDVTRVGGSVTVAQATAASLNAEVQGDAAHDAAVSGNPVLTAGIAETPDDSAPTNQVSAEGDATRLACDRDGALYTHPHPPRIWHVAAEQTTQQTDTAVKAAPGAGLSLYITGIKLSCNGAVTVTFEEGTTVLKYRYYAAAAGDGSNIELTVPIKITANTSFTVTTSAAVTVFYLVTGYTAP